MSAAMIVSLEGLLGSLKCAHQIGKASLKCKVGDLNKAHVDLKLLSHA